jgi:hypothetical protein
MPSNSTYEEFVEKARLKHSVKYNYSKAEYVKSCIKVNIVCDKHGDFYQTPGSHLRGRGCPLCANSLKGKEASIEASKNFEARAKIIHKDHYDYSEVDYYSARTHVSIICPVHGCFTQTPDGHLSGKGCLKCGNKERGDAVISSSRALFIPNSNLVHDNLFNYDKVDYLSANSKVIITCKVHGDFTQTPSNHLRGSGCPLCSLYTFDVSKVSSLYVLLTDSYFVGFGITGHICDRLRCHKRSLHSHNIKILGTYIFNGLGGDVLEAEIFIKQNFVDCRTIVNGFKTEAFTDKKLQFVLDYLRNNIKLQALPIFNSPVIHPTENNPSS